MCIEYYMLQKQNEIEKIYRMFHDAHYCKIKHFISYGFLGYNNERKLKDNIIGWIIDKI